MARVKSPAGSALRASRTARAWSSDRLARLVVGSVGRLVGDGFGAVVGLGGLVGCAARWLGALVGGTAVACAVPEPVGCCAAGVVGSAASVGEGAAGAAV